MEGKDVDWFAAVKTPSGLDDTKGKSFAYFDSAQTDKGSFIPICESGLLHFPCEFKWSPKLINSTDSAIGATINQLYKINKDTTFTIAYNDDSPDDKVNGYRAHSKEVAVFNKEVGFWMIHSVPNFPPSTKYGFPDSGSVYAQSFLCLSLSVNSLEDVGQYMRFAQVTPFFSNLPEFHEIIAPSLVDVVGKKSLPRSATVFTTIRELKTLGGRSERILEAQKIWSRPLVYDVEEVNLLGEPFPSSKDHSKWGVSMNVDKPAVCIGDVNRQVSQFNRGGGAVCIEDKKLWQAFHGSVAKYEKCGKT
ncbi:hypothetical protein Aduo_009836 [Ancylostoma duodenale]